MRTPRRCLALMALAAYLLVGGQGGFCALWNSLDIEHHHHQASEHSHDATGVCGKEVAACDEPAVPCGDSEEQDANELTALVPDSPLPIVSPFVGEVPMPAADFSAALAPESAAAAHAAILDAVRGSPPTRPALLCRFLV